MDLVAVKQKYVWWDVDCCHIPRGCDPYEVRLIIESALNKKFGAGPVTIFAIGNMNRIPRPVLELISRAGIVGKTKTNPAPAILMLISDRENEYIYLEALQVQGYEILRTYVNQKPDSPKYACDVWIWKNLLTDTKQETPRHKDLHDETYWDCILCCEDGHSFKDFTKHLETEEHLRFEWFLVHPTKSPTIQDLASFHFELMDHTVKQSKPRKHFGSQKEKADPMMVKLLSEPHKDVKSFMAALWGPPDCEDFFSAAGPSEECPASLEKNHL